MAASIPRRLAWNDALVLAHRYEESILYLADVLRLLVHQEQSELAPCLARVYFEYANAYLLRVERARDEQKHISQEDAELALTNMQIARMLLERHGAAACVPPSERAAHDLLARVLVRTGDHHAGKDEHFAAVEAYAEALRIRRDAMGEVATVRVVDIHTMLAISHAASGQGEKEKAQAREHYGAAVELIKACVTAQTGASTSGGGGGDWSVDGAGKNVANIRAAAVSLIEAKQALQKAGIELPDAVHT